MNFIPTVLAATQKSSEESDAMVPEIFGKIIAAVVIVVVTFVLATLLRNWIHRIIRKKQGDRHKEVMILYGRIVFTTTLVVGIIIALTIVGAPLEYFSGGVGLGIAFSLKEVLVNFFSGIVLLSNDKFNLGDFVILDDGTGGTIVDIQSRATSLRAIDGGEVTIPNSLILSAKVKCYTKNPIRRHAIEIGVGYGANLKVAAELIKKTLKANENVEPEPEPMVLVNEIADSAVILQARFWTESKTQWWVIKSDLTREIFNALNKAGVDIPYPVQTLRVDKDSSDLLAENPHFLENLKEIELQKQVLPSSETVFQKSPVETAATSNF